MIDVVAFDLMDTVVRDPFRDALVAAVGRPLAEVLALRDRDAWHRFERGEVSEQEYFSSYERLHLDVDVFQRVRRGGYVVLPGMRQLLGDLAGHVLRATATNYPVWVEELATGLLAGLFDQVIASHHLGVRKPERAFFERLCRAVGTDAGSVLLVDDRMENVAGARAAGLHAHPFLGAADLRDRLRREGLPV
ncbi:MAG: HAD-IA family hydrolase [Actinomycetota bacterium]|nr:HAD-IA family hydrolase [Actinomycetota bacterium]